MRNIWGIIILSCVLSSGCKHLPKIQPGSLSLHLSGDTAEVMRKVLGHTAVTPSRYGTLYLIKASEVTLYLECHENWHAKEQAATFENDFEWVKAYYGESIRSAWISIQEDFMENPGHYIDLVMRIVRNEVDLLALTKEEGERLIRMAYWNNRYETEARAACEHLRGVQ